MSHWTDGCVITHWDLILRQHVAKELHGSEPLGSLPGRSDPSAEMSRTRLGKSILAEGIACAETLRWVEKLRVQRRKAVRLGLRFSMGCWTCLHPYSCHMSIGSKDGA